MNPQFNTNPSFLSIRFFNPDNPKIGANTYLNVNVLPDFVEYIKKNLTSEELIALSEYQLQTYIMELSIKQKITDSFDSLVRKILAHVRERKQFWTNGNIVKGDQKEEKQKQDQKHQHEAIEQYQKDIVIISEKVPKYPQKIFNNIKKTKIQPFLQTLTTSFTDNSKQFLKINITNYSMMPAFVLKQYLIQERKIQDLPIQEQLTEDQLNLLHTLENAVQYFLMQQKPRLNTTHDIKRRQMIRQRRMPAYLSDNFAGSNLLHDNNLEEVDQSVYSKQSHEIHPSNQSKNLKPSYNCEDIKIFTPKNQQIIEVQSSQNQQTQSDEENQFYQCFHSQISKKSFYDSKMFSKETLINQSHNIMQILRCIVYIYSGDANTWFERRWKEMEEQKITREKRRRQDEKSEQDDESSHNKIEDQNQKIQERNDNNQKFIRLQKQQNRKEIQNQLNELKNYQKDDHNQNLQKIELQKEEQQNLNKIKEDEQNSAQQQLQSESQIIEIGIRKPIFDDTWKTPQSWSYNKLLKHLSQKFLSLREIYFVTKEYFNRQIMSQFNTQKSYFLQKQAQSKSLQNALVDPQTINLDLILLQFKQMIEHPQNIKLGAFKTQGITIPWEETEYLLFLKGLVEYFFIPTNNRKIAQYMMSKSHKKTIQANHVKYVKAIYLKNIQTRSDRGESGGGKKGKMPGKIEFIKKDIEFFSMKWFDKIKKSKKKSRRRRFDDDQAAEEVDSAY